MINCSVFVGSPPFLDLTKTGQEIVAASHNLASLIPTLNISLASRFSMPITWEDVANERSTEKLVQLCKEKIVPPKNFLLRSIIMGQKDWVQPLVDCGSSPAEAFDYLTPALAWMSRFPKEPFPPSLQSTPYETEVLERKLLAHLFEIDGSTIINNKIIPLESFAPSYFWSRITDITKELGKRNQTLSKINRLPLFENAVLLSDKAGIDFKESPIHIIKTGDRGSRARGTSAHAAALVLSENFIAHVSDGVSVGRYISSALPTNIKSVLSPFSLIEETYETVLKKLYKETQATPISKIPFLKDRPLIQLVNNCAWKTAESSLFAVRLLESLEALNSESRKTAQEILKNCYSKINAILDLKDQEAILSKQKCEDDAKYYATRFIENKGSASVYELLQDHQRLIKKIKELVLEEYYLYRNNLSDEINQEIPVDSNLMMKITRQFPQNIMSSRTIS